MKTNDVNDPLKKNDFNEKQPETENTEPLKEEKENEQDQTVQEKNPKSSAENIVAESGTPSATEPPAEPSTEPPAEPSTELRTTQNHPQNHRQNQPQNHPAEPSTEPPAETSTAEAEEQSEPEIPEQLKKSGPSKKSEAEKLIDDLEEKEKNAIYDDTIDHEDHRHHSQEEQINFSLLSKEDLVKIMREKLDNPGKGNIRKDVEEIKRAFYDKISETVEGKKEAFP